MYRNVKRLRAATEDNAKLKKLIAESMLDNGALKDGSAKQ
jgi:hypothetical protein